ncbi:MAG: sugar transferase, partial [Actinomycetota bacterium]|nr:sugar transferase [Actinomycetota bacterium]
YRLRLLLPDADASGYDPREHLIFAVVSLPVWLGIFVHYRLYRANEVAARRQELGRLVHATAASVAMMALAGFMAKMYVARGWLVFTFAIGLPMLIAEREVVRRILASLRRRRKLLRRVLIVGGNADAVALCDTLRADPVLGYDVLGIIADVPASSHVDEDRPALLGSVDETLEVAEAIGAQGVIVVTTAVGMAAANRLARELPDAGIRVEVVSALRDIAVERLTLRTVGRFPILHVDRVHRHGWRAAAKRGFDVAVAASGLVVLSPVVLVTAMAVRLSSPGPVFFRQKRLGREGALFEILKFRTMVPDAEERLAGLRQRNEAGGPLFKLQHDPRVTRVGRVLRRLSLDELPQLWNVLRGEMSLVGPRPALPHEVTGWSPELHQRLRVTPGITGMWQVCGRSHASFDDYSRLDLYYVDNWSLLVDLTILAKTIPAVFSRRGAY